MTTLFFLAYAFGALCGLICGAWLALSYLSDKEAERPIVYGSQAWWDSRAQK